jgi:hypothetical protein
VILGGDKALHLPGALLVTKTMNTASRIKGAVKPTTTTTSLDLLVVGANDRFQKFKPPGGVEGIRQNSAMAGLAILETLCQATRRSAGEVLSIVTRMSKDSILKEVAEEQMFEAMVLVAHADDQVKGKCFAIGFLKGKLVYCDGNSHRPITLKQSAKEFYRVINTGQWTGDYKAQHRWFTMVAKALPKDSA